MDSTSFHRNKMEHTLVSHHGNIFYIYIYVQCHLGLNLTAIVECGLQHQLVQSLFVS